MSQNKVITIEGGSIVLVFDLHIEHIVPTSEAKLSHTFLITLKQRNYIDIKLKGVKKKKRRVDAVILLLYFF